MPRAKLPPIHIKVGIIIKRPMSKAEAEKLKNRAIRTGIVPEGIELAYVDWERGKGKKFRSGRYVGEEAHQALLDFRRALRHPRARKRFKKVVEDE